MLHSIHSFASAEPRVRASILHDCLENYFPFSLSLSFPFHDDVIYDLLPVRHNLRSQKHNVEKDFSVSAARESSSQVTEKMSSARGSYERETKDEFNEANQRDACC